MKEFNFNTLRDLPVPESWIENAIAIPEQEAARKAAVPLWRKPRVIAAAASVVLVSALTLALYLSFGTKPPVTVKPSATEIIWSTDENGETVAIERIITYSETEPTQYQNGTTPTGDTLSTIIYRPGQTDSTIPATKTNPSESRKPSPTTKTSPTESGKSTETTSPKPTAAPAQPTEKPQVPTEKPPTPTEAEPEPPTATPWVNPTEPSWEWPTEPSATWHISASIPWDVHSGRDYNVFCRLETADGEIIGKGGLYDSNRRMIYLGSDRQKNIYSYQFKNNIIIPDELKGAYVNYYVYDIEGNILKSGTCQL